MLLGFLKDLPMQVNMGKNALCTLMTSQPLSSATSVGELKGKVRSTPFSVPIQRALWATATVDIWIGM